MIQAGVDAAMASRLARLNHQTKLPRWDDSSMSVQVQDYPNCSTNCATAGTAFCRSSGVIAGPGLRDLR